MAALLGERGAVIIDADVVAREVVRAGTPGFAAIVARFGPGVVGPDGELNRAELARIVFADSSALDDLNAIVHPLVGSRSAELRRRARRPGPSSSTTSHSSPRTDWPIGSMRSSWCRPIERSDSPGWPSGD